MKIRAFISAGVLFATLAFLVSGSGSGREAWAAEDASHVVAEMGYFERLRAEHEASISFPAVDNEAYMGECGDCHFLYYPGLLPSASWRKIMAESDEHFGDELGLDEETAAEILAYLEANAAENSTAMRAKNIARSVGRKVPARITEVRYIKVKHSGIKKSVLKRDSIMSLSNCGACHTTAREGNFSERHLDIPD